MKKLLLLASVFFSVTTFAQAKFPDQCKIMDSQFAQDNLLLVSKNSTPRLYAITNVGKNPVWLNHEKKNAGMGAGFASQLYPNHWSALLVNEANFPVTCHAQTTKGQMLNVSCQKILRVCEFNNVTITKSGQYWVVENVMQSELKPRINARGF